jgi:adenosylhomocysteine nucleosidase
MSELQIDDPCIVFALARESQPFRREFRPQQRFGGAPCWARFCGPPWLTVLVLHSGVGSAATTSVGEWLLGSPKLGDLPYRPKLVIAAGFAGALRDGLNVGDVVLATEIADMDGNVWPATWPDTPITGEWRPPLHRGRVLTAAELAAAPARKAELGARHGAVAVDMESAVLAKLCARAEVPFGCVRAISDDVRTELSPRLVALLSGGRVSPWRTLTTFVRAPATAAEFWRLAKYTGLASRQLGAALGELLTLSLPWSGELEGG